MESLNPTNFGDHYQVVRPLGRGGMGVVYLVHNRRLRREEAMKVLRRDNTDDPRQLEIFAEEALRSASLDHPAIVTVYAAGESPDGPFFTMAYMSGGTLADRLYDVRKNVRESTGSAEALAPPPPEETITVLTQVASALDYAHGKGILHRDVKPQNILLDYSNPVGLQAKIADFGIARAMDTTTGGFSGGLVGTPHYMSPEHCAGQVPLGGRSDQYSLACVAYELLSGMPPYGKRDTGGISVALAHATETIHPERLDAIPNPYPKEVADVIAKGLSKRRDDRYRSCTEFVAALVDAIQNSTIGKTTDAGRKKLPLLSLTLVGLICFAKLVPFYAANQGLPGTKEDAVPIPTAPETTNRREEPLAKDDPILFAPKNEVPRELQSLVENGYLHQIQIFAKANPRQISEQRVATHRQYLKNNGKQTSELNRIAKAQMDIELTILTAGDGHFVSTQDRPGAIRHYINAIETLDELKPANIPEGPVREYLEDVLNFVRDYTIAIQLKKPNHFESPEFQKAKNDFNIIRKRLLAG